MCNYRHPGPRRVWKGGSDLHSDPPFPVNPVDPVDPVENNGRLVFAVIYKVFFTFFRKMIVVFGVELLWCPLGAQTAPDAV